MYDRSTKILSVFTAVFLFLFLTEVYPMTGDGSVTENIFVTETVAVSEGKEKKNDESQKEESHTKDETKTETETGKLRESTSEPRMIAEQTLIKKRISSLSDEEFEVLCRIVQAEAGGEDTLGKQMVADVIINRVCSHKFPNSVSGVVFQQNGGKTQFSPVRDGRYYSVNVTSDTREAVNNALNGADSTNGSLYFVNASKANPGNLSWFENCLAFQVEHGGHRFYK